MSQMKPCITCLYFSQHWLGAPLDIDNECSHPKLMYHNKLDDVWHKVSCKAMRSKEYWCGPHGRFWTAGVQ